MIRFIHEENEQLSFEIGPLEPTDCKKKTYTAPNVMG